MLIMIVLLVYRIIMIKQIEQTQVAKDVVRLHIVAASTILFYAMTILDINDTVALASYGLYFWCSDFLLIFFFIYINDFTFGSNGNFPAFEFNPWDIDSD